MNPHAYGPKSTRRTAMALAAALMLLPAVFSVAFASKAQAVDNGTLGIHPATESDFFHLSAAPGDVLNETAIINNYTSAPVSLLSYVVDGLTTPQGAFALANQDSIPTSVGLWSPYKAQTIVVPAESELAVPFSIRIPADATPGDYSGGLIIQEPLESGAVTNAPDGTPVRMDIIHRQGVRIYLTVSGARTAMLQAGGLSWSQSGDSVQITLPISNTGNTTLHPQGDVTFSSILGVNEKIEFQSIESVTPGSSIDLHATLSDAAFIQLGQVTAQVSSEAPTLTAASSFVNIPWWILAGILAIAIAMALLLSRAIRFTAKARAAIRRIEKEDIVLPLRGRHG